MTLFDSTVGVNLDPQEWARGSMGSELSSLLLSEIIGKFVSPTGMLTTGSALRKQG